MNTVLDKSEIDPRTKMLIVICLSTLGVVYTDVILLSLILLMTFSFSFLFKADLKGVFKRFKRLIQMILVIIVVQSIFNREGVTLFHIGSLTILTDVGLIKGIEFILRMLIIISSATILSTSNNMEMIQGLIKCKIPYDLAFMVCIGLRFIPVLSDEFKDTVTAIQIRGINIKKLSLKKKLDLVSITVMPVIIGTLDKSKKLASSIENRGFRAYDKRTSIYKLKLLSKDYFLMLVIILLTTGVVIINILYIKR